MKLSLAPLKYVIGCWTCLETTSVYIKGKRVEWPWGLKSPIGLFFMLVLSIVMVQWVLCWERLKRLSRCRSHEIMVMKRHLYEHIYIYYQTLLKLEERREEERGGDKTWKIIQRFAFWAYIKENQHIHFLMHGHSSRSAFSVHLVRGPKVFSFAFLINLTTKLRSRSVTMEKGHLSWDNIVVHDCKQPLRTIFPFDTTDR